MNQTEDDMIPKFLIATMALALSAPAHADVSGASLWQEGGDNDLNVDQSDAFVSSTRLQQIGLQNSASIVQQQVIVSYVEALQEGYGNHYEVLQFSGENMYALILQGTFLDPSSNNVAGIIQTGLANDGQLFQLGDSNRAFIHQDGAGGPTNHGYIMQQGVGQRADMVQNGRGNDAFVQQFRAENSRISVGQNGDGNYGYIDQIDALDSTARIRTIGNGNFVGGPTLPPGGISSPYEQLGIVQMQVTNARADVYQQGDANGAWVFQNSGANLEVSIAQGGALAGGGPAFGSYVQVTQSGFDNEATLLQSGTGNYGFVRQLGDGGGTNFARSTQLGTGHVSSIYQDGAGNRGTVSQR